MKKKYLEPTTETAPLFLSAGIMSGNGNGDTNGSNIEGDGGSDF